MPGLALRGRHRAGAHLAISQDSTTVLLSLPGTGYGLRYEYGMFRQSFVNGWQQENPDNWLRDGDPWEICRRHEKVDINLNVTFKLRDGRVEVIRDRP